MAYAPKNRVPKPRKLYPDPTTNTSFTIAPRRFQAFCEMCAIDNIEKGSAIRNAVELVYGARLDEIEKTL